VSPHGVSLRWASKIVARYHSIPDYQVAQAEGCSTRKVRAARLVMGRGPDLGTYDDSKATPAHHTARGQLSFGDLDLMMRRNESSCG
jgi:hypothetical protein